MASLKDLMTDDKGLFQGGKEGRTFGRVRDLIDRMRNKGIPSKSGNSGNPGVDINQGLMGEAASKVVPGTESLMYRKQAPDLSSFEYNPDQEFTQGSQKRASFGDPYEEGAVGKYQLYSSSGQRMGTTDSELNPTQRYFATVGKWIEDNPNATRAEVSRYKRDQRAQMSKDLKAERIAKLEQNPTFVANRNAREAKNAKHMLKMAQNMGLINVPDEAQLGKMNWAEMRKLRNAEKARIEDLVMEGYSESDAIKILADKFNLKDKVKGMKASDIGTGKNLERLIKY